MNGTKWKGVHFKDGEIMICKRQCDLRRAIELRKRYYGVRCPYRFFKAIGETANEALMRYFF